MNTPTTDRYDPYDPGFREDPYPAYADLRRTCPVHHLTMPTAEVERTNANPTVAVPTSEFWSVSRYADVRDVVQNNEVFSSSQGPGPERLAAPDGVGMLIYADQPHHSRQRRIVVQAFHPRVINALRPRLRQICDDLIDGFPRNGEVDIVPAYAAPVAIQAMSLILGVSPEDQDKFKRWTDDQVKAFGGDPDSYEQSFRSLTEFQAYFTELIDQRRAAIDEDGENADDVLNRLIHADYEERQFSTEELLMALHILLVAGIDTVNHAIGNGLQLLLAHPAQLELLRREPDRWTMAVEEILRFEAPAQALFRNTNADTVVAGCPIPSGAKVRLLFASANRDPDVFDDPDTFDIDRDPQQLRKHLAFGHGIHACVGAALGRALLEVALRTLLDRLPDIRLDESSPPRRDLGRFHTRSWSTLPVRWTP